MRRLGTRMLDYMLSVAVVWMAGFSLAGTFVLGYALGRDNGRTVEQKIVYISSNRVAQRYIDSIAALQGRPRHDDAVQAVPKVQPQHGARRSGKR